MFDLGSKGEGGNPIEDFLKKMGGDDIVIRTMVNDQRLGKLAEYEITKGYTTMQFVPEQVQAKFQEFKSIVKKGQMSLSVLEDDVYKRWGVAEANRDETTGAKGSCAQIGFHNVEIEVAEIPEGSEQDH